MIFSSSGFFPRYFAASRETKFVAGAVRAVSSHFVFLIICVIYGVHIRIFGHREMESRVEDQSHGRFGHRRAAGLDADDCGGIVQGREILDLFHHRHGFGRNERRLFECFARSDHSVTDRIDFFHRRNHARFFIRQRFQHQLYGDVMVGHGLFDDNFLSACFMRELGAVDADTLAVALGDDLLRLHVDKLIFEGRASRIDD